MKIVSDVEGRIRLDTKTQSVVVRLAWGKFWIVDNGLAFKRPDSVPTGDHGYYRWIDGIFCKVFPLDNTTPNDNLWQEPQEDPERVEMRERYNFIEALREKRTREGSSVERRTLEEARGLALRLGLPLAVERYQGYIREYDTKALHETLQYDPLAPTVPAITIEAGKLFRTVVITTPVNGYSDQAIALMTSHMNDIDAVLSCQYHKSGHYLVTTWKSQEALNKWVTDRMLTPNVFLCTTCDMNMVLQPDTICDVCHDAQDADNIKADQYQHGRMLAQHAKPGDKVVFMGADSLINYGVFVSCDTQGWGCFVNTAERRMGVEYHQIMNISPRERETTTAQELQGDFLAATAEPGDIVFYTDNHQIKTGVFVRRLNVSPGIIVTTDSTHVAIKNKHILALGAVDVTPVQEAPFVLAQNGVWSSVLMIGVPTNE